MNPLLATTSFVIPDDHFAVRGRPDALIGWFELSCMQLIQIGSPFFPVPHAIGRSDGDLHVWVFPDTSPQVVIEGEVGGIEMLPAGYTVLL